MGLFERLLIILLPKILPFKLVWLCWAHLDDHQPCLEGKYNSMVYNSCLPSMSRLNLKCCLCSCVCFLVIFAQEFWLKIILPTSHNIFFLFSPCIQILAMILFLIKIHFKFCIKPGNLIGLWKNSVEHFGISIFHASDSFNGFYFSIKNIMWNFIKISMCHMSRLTQIILLLQLWII